MPPPEAPITMDILDYTLDDTTHNPHHSNPASDSQDDPLHHGNPTSPQAVAYAGQSISPLPPVHYQAQTPNQDFIPLRPLDHFTHHINIEPDARTSNAHPRSSPSTSRPRPCYDFTCSPHSSPFIINISSDHTRATPHLDIEITSSPTSSASSHPPQIPTSEPQSQVQNASWNKQTAIVTTIATIVAKTDTPPLALRLPYSPHSLEAQFSSTHQGSFVDVFEHALLVQHNSTISPQYITTDSGNCHLCLSKIQGGRLYVSGISLSVAVLPVWPLFKNFRSLAAPPVIFSEKLDFLIRPSA
ncbi:hypothetical protein DL93DRAFT_2170631 [Clavulina sp. PMI_390]|nr:hypothetical protein DL93DRAFT_2170631 [Clavulina sp. PMI_390]